MTLSNAQIARIAEKRDLFEYWESRGIPLAEQKRRYNLLRNLDRTISTKGRARKEHEVSVDPQTMDKTVDFNGIWTYGLLPEELDWESMSGQ